VVAITEADIRELALFKGEGAPVTSCYLDVDGSRFVRHQDVVLELDSLLRDARARANGDRSVADDLRRIQEHVRGGLDRSSTRGLAIFSCSAHGFWKVVELPVPVRSQIVVNHTPTVRQLEEVIDDHPAFGLLLADKQRARVMVFEMGELIDSADLVDQLPRGDDDDHSYTKDHNRDHTAALSHQHLRHAADLAFEVYKARPFERLIISAHDEIATELESALHPYLRERVEARCTIPVSAGDEEIRAVAFDVEAQMARRSEAEAVERLRESVGGNRRGVAGLDSTLQALVERRVETLLVSENFEHAGWRCGSCGYIGRIGRRCPVCEADMAQVDDVVEQAVEEAVLQSCKVKLCRGNADLDVLGSIGALLRY
jgi:peptide chain release factor subunit 1